jgi:DNA-binding PadR family transcriptional regulator
MLAMWTEVRSTRQQEGSMSATKKTSAKNAARTTPAKRPTAKRTPTTIEQVLHRLSTASKEFVDEVEEQMRHLEDRVGELRERGEETAEHWVDVIEARVSEIRSDLEGLARRVRSPQASPAKRTAATKPSAKRVPAAKRAAARKAPARKAPAKRTTARKVAAR